MTAAKSKREESKRGLEVNSVLSKDVVDLLGSQSPGSYLPNCDSRSLILNRYANPGFVADDRRQLFERAIKAQHRSEKLQAWPTFIDKLLRRGARALFARLESRLLIDMAGGTLENAGLRMDRFGVPFIPGSAIKGCVRNFGRLYITKRIEDGARDDEIAKLIAELAIMLGWGERDWKHGRQEPKKEGEVGEFESDFEHACGCAERWVRLLPIAQGFLLAWLNERSQAHGASLDSLPQNFQGLLSFLPAYPISTADYPDAKNPEIGEPPISLIEIDILNSHHGGYYSGDSVVALDNESPNPVSFPGVATNTIFRFTIAPARDPRDIKWVERGVLFLRSALKSVGIGAKTNAGYGWFSATDSMQETLIESTAKRIRKDAEDRIREAEDKLAADKAKEKEKREEELRKLLEGLPEDERALASLYNLEREQILQKLIPQNLEKLPDDEVKLLLQLLQAAPDAKYSRREIWEFLNDDSQHKGKKRKQWPRTVQILRRRASALKFGKLK